MVYPYRRLPAAVVRLRRLEGAATKVYPHPPRTVAGQRINFGLQTFRPVRESKAMVLPQFTLRMALGLMAVLGFVSLLIARGLQGSSWAMGVTIALAALVFAFLTYAAVFGLVYGISRIFQRPSSPRGRNAVPAATELPLPEPRDNSQLVAPSASEPL
jgi:hypothetical protein